MRLNREPFNPTASKLDLSPRENDCAAVHRMHRWRYFREVFNRIVDLPSSERSEALAQICGEDHDLHERVERLLAADDLAQRSRFLERSCGFHNLPIPRDIPKTSHLKQPVGEDQHMFFPWMMRLRRGPKDSK